MSTASATGCVWIHASTHPGKVRPQNEDAVGCSDWSAQGTVSLISHRYTGSVPVVCVVADGLGGHRGGEVASVLAVQRLVHGPAPGSVKELVGDIQAAHEEIVRHAQSDPALAGMGTTAAIVVATAETVLCANVGDSRVYEISDGSVLPVSFDDTPRQPDDGPPSSIVTQALGGPRPTRLDPHAQWFAREPGLAFLLCSDGVTNLVADDELGQLLTVSPGPAGVTRVIEACLERGAPDNVSALLVLVDPPDEPLADARPAASNPTALSAEPQP